MSIPFLAVCTGKYDRRAFQDSEAIAVIDTLAEGYETILAAMWGEAVGVSAARKSHEIRMQR